MPLYRTLGADNLDPTALSAHIATVTTSLDTWRMVGLNLYLTLYDAVVGRLLIAVGQPEWARSLDTGLQLADDTGMHFYDAEPLRLRAHTHTDPDARQADIAAARELARRQGATLFELRAALDDFELRGEPRALPLSTRPGECPPTARSRNWRVSRLRRSHPTRNSGSSAASRSGGRSLGIPAGHGEDRDQRTHCQSPCSAAIADRCERSIIYKG